MMADLRLAAWFLWMMPLAAALSSFFTARRSASVESSLPDSAAATARLTRVLISEQRYQRADQPPKSASSRRPAAPRKRRASVRRNSFMVGRPAAAARVECQAR